MDIRITGIDTSNNDIVTAYISTTENLYPTFQNVQINIIDATTLEILLR